jgi:outer membrane protein assembly factor BamB
MGCIDHYQGGRTMSWRWTGNHANAPKAAAAATAVGAGAGEAIFEVNDDGTVGLYVFDNAVSTGGRSWRWMGNHESAPAAVNAANASGAGVGAAVYAANDGGTVGLYLLK